MKSRFYKIAISWLICVVAGFGADQPEPAFMAHYMPWYASKSVSGNWGWHWTMNKFDPDKQTAEGHPEIASHDVPLIGPYDSGDPDLLECQVLQMKLSGIDGIIFDWYGIHDANDYAMIHRNVQKMIPFLERAGLTFAICFEDQAIRGVVERAKANDRKPLPTATESLAWVNQNWLTRPSYFRINDRPLLLTFGPQYLEKVHWQSLRKTMDAKPLIYALPHLAEIAEADGVFAWPPVESGKTTRAHDWKNKLNQLYTGESPAIAVAFPGFHDIYQQAGKRKSYGHIQHKNGKTFEASLNQGIAHNGKLIQLATWNDYGEGTVIEPTVEHGYHYLEILQGKARQRQRNPLRSAPGDLRLPTLLYQLRKSPNQASVLKAQLDKAADALFNGHCDAAAEILHALAPKKEKSKHRLVSQSPRYRLATNIPYRTGNKLTPYEKQRCFLDVYYPEQSKPAPAVVWFHGGGLKAGNREIPEELKKQGLIVVAVDYRLHPIVKSPAYVQDAAASVAWTFNNIEQYGGSPDQIFVAGHSAGGYLASMIGLDKRWLKPHDIDADRIAGLIPYSGHSITHFTIRKERGISGKQPIVDDMAPLFHVKKAAPPILLITGDRDKELLGRYEETAYFWRMMKVAGNATTELYELEGYDHGGMAKPAFPLLVNFVKKHAKKEK